MKTTLAIIACVFVVGCSGVDHAVKGGMQRPDGRRPPPPAYTNEPAIWQGGAL